MKEEYNPTCSTFTAYYSLQNSKLNCNTKITHKNLKRKGGKLVFVTHERTRAYTHTQARNSLYRLMNREMR